MYSAAGAAWIAGAAILIINRQEGSYLRHQSDVSANTRLPIHFFVQGKKVGPTKGKIKSNVRNIARC